MGYYTAYTINYNNKSKSKQYAATLAMINSNCFSNDETLESLIKDEPMKWYSHDQDMLALSSIFPDEIFILEGDGEDSNDIWRTYYHNGKKQFTLAKIIFDDFDLEKLR